MNTLTKLSLLLGLSLGVPLFSQAPASAGVAVSACPTNATAAALEALGSSGCDVSGLVNYSNFSFAGDFSSLLFNIITPNGQDFALTGASTSGAGLAASTYVYSYDVAIIGSPGVNFASFTTDMITTLNVPLFGTKNLTGSSGATVQSSGVGPSAPYIYPSPGIAGPVTFTSVISVTGGTVNTIADQVSFQLAPTSPSASVPGPLPLLGAGAAFGFSRKLRQRLTARR